jgi:hypothetical protein
MTNKELLGLYIRRGFIYFSLIGGGLVFFVLMLLKRELPLTNPLNREYQESPMWGWGIMMMFGPILGCIFWLLRFIYIELKKTKAT